MPSFDCLLANLATPTLPELIELVRELPAGLLYTLALLGGAIEYFLPILPGDTLIVALGAVAAVHPASGVVLLMLTIAASTLGGLCSYEIGRAIERVPRFQAFRERHRGPIDTVIERFERHGPAYLAINRFIPGLRTFFFIAAALAGIRRTAVLMWSFISSTLWMTLLFGVAYALSDNIDRVQRAVRNSSLTFGIIAILIVAYFVHAGLKARSEDRSE